MLLCTLEQKQMCPQLVTKADTYHPRYSGS